MESSTLIINDEKKEPKSILQMVKAFCNPGILKSCGGYIFTYRIYNNSAYLGIKPSIIEGQRINHYDLNAGPETKVFLTGSINTNGEISLLFKISKTELNDEIKSELRELYLNFSDLLINNGYKGSGILDWITQRIIEESQLFIPIPSTIFDLPPALSLSS